MNQLTEIDEAVWTTFLARRDAASLTELATELEVTPGLLAAMMLKRGITKRPVVAGRYTPPATTEKRATPAPQPPEPVIAERAAEEALPPEPTPDPDTAEEPLPPEPTPKPTSAPKPNRKTTEPKPQRSKAKIRVEPSEREQATAPAAAKAQRAPVDARLYAYAVVSNDQESMVIAASLVEACTRAQNVLGTDVTAVRRLGEVIR